jgi:hypothetical protein
MGQTDGELLDLRARSQASLEATLHNLKTVAERQRERS